MPHAPFLPLDGRASPGGWGGFRPLAGRPIARLGSWLGLLAGLVPAAVLACPSCTARAPESPGGAGELLLALMLVPFALVGVGLWAARRAGPEAPGAERASAPVEQEHP
ncbi:hypothetical protein [Corallococcus aberystwythensis]|uniref:Uncharacterized protein n=1 Tax=Corallococcus aberystwythensis TaxID=2316722 RepID=A0A3A8PHP5_9BACT|nr:hypothetical protein [Corallococcus aberystwythensis]RKH54830.1 hypothetical protein D7W81_37590 [Corallococcus aberystwythensis]